MWYIIFAQDVEGSLKTRLKVKEQHLDRLRTLQNEGRLLVAGLMPAIDSEEPEALGFTGSTIIADFPSLMSAKEWASNDPYTIAGIYENVIVKPFKQVLPS